MVRAIVKALVNAALLYVATLPWLVATIGEGPHRAVVDATLFPALFVLAVGREIMILVAVEKGMMRVARLAMPLSASGGVSSALAAGAQAVILLSVTGAVYLALDGNWGAAADLSSAREAALVYAATIAGFWALREGVKLFDASSGDLLIARRPVDPVSWCAQVVTRRAPWGTPFGWLTLRAPNGLAFGSELAGVSVRDLHGAGIYQWTAAVQLAGFALYERHLVEPYGAGDPTPLKAPWRTTSVLSLVALAAVLGDALEFEVAIAFATLGVCVGAVTTFIEGQS